MIVSNKYKHGDIVPDDVICKRLNELADAVTKGSATIDREFTMRIPAEMDRDADLVLSYSAKRIKQLAKRNKELEGALLELINDGWNR